MTPLDFGNQSEQPPAQPPAQPPGQPSAQPAGQPSAQPQGQPQAPPTQAAAQPPAQAAGDAQPSWGDGGGGLRFGGISPGEYWKRNIICVLGLLVVWFLVSYGCGILWADKLDELRTPGGGVPVGFWFAQQGSIFVFVVLIAVYVKFMNKLDAKYFGDTK